MAPDSKAQKVTFGADKEIGLASYSADIIKRLRSNAELNIDEALLRHAQRLSAALRREAFLAGWPTNVCRKLYMRYFAGEFQPAYPFEVSQDVENLEFGTQDNPPNPVLLRFMNRLDQYSRPLDEEISSYVGELVMF